MNDSEIWNIWKESQREYDKMFRQSQKMFELLMLILGFGLGFTAAMLLMIILR